MAKRNKLAPMGFAVNRKTGVISEVVNISRDTLDDVNANLNEMHGIIKSCAGYDHSRRLDSRWGESVS